MSSWNMDWRLPYIMIAWFSYAERLKRLVSSQLLLHTCEARKYIAAGSITPSDEEVACWHVVFLSYNTLNCIYVSITKL
jgi:hypothetical protein